MTLQLKTCSSFIENYSRHSQLFICQRFILHMQGIWETRKWLCNTYFDIKMSYSINNSKTHYICNIVDLICVQKNNLKMQFPTTSTMPPNSNNCGSPSSQNSIHLTDPAVIRFASFWHLLMKKLVWESEFVWFRW